MARNNCPYCDSAYTLCPGHPELNPPQPAESVDVGALRRIAELDEREGDTLCNARSIARAAIESAGGAKGEKPFKAPGAWFPLTVLGQPMREFAPGKWEHASWPSEAPQPDGGDEAVYELRSMRSTHAAYAAQAQTMANAALHEAKVAALDAAISALTRPSPAAQASAGVDEAVAVVISTGYPQWLVDWLGSPRYRQLPTGTLLYTRPSAAAAAWTTS
jgi:hypothetical protein